MDDTSHPTIQRIRHHIGTALFGAVFPNRCMVCGDFYPVAQYPVEGFPDFRIKNDGSTGFADRDIGRWISPFVCPDCSTDFIPVRSPICAQCGIMFGTMDDEDHLCDGCMQEPKQFRIVRAIGVYDQTCMELIHAFKYRRKIQLAKPFGVLLFIAFIQHWSNNDIDLIVPVPLHRKRLRERGFNQAHRIVRGWLMLAESAIAGGVGIPPVRIERTCLIRNRVTDPQIGLKRHQRISNVKNVFAISDPSPIEGKEILLVDDVYTTGATVDACTGVLLKNGAKFVDVLTLVRAM